MMTSTQRNITIAVFIFVAIGGGLTLMRTYGMQGDIRNAFEMCRNMQFEQALEEFDRLEPKAQDSFFSSDAASFYLAKGECLLFSAQGNDNDAHTQQALDTMEKGLALLGDDGSELYAHGLLVRARILLRLSPDGETLRLLQKAAQDQETAGGILLSAGNSPELFQARLELGITLRHLASFTERTANLERSVQVLQTLLNNPPVDPGRDAKASAYMQLGMSLQESRSMDNRETVEKQCAEAYEKALALLDRHREPWKYFMIQSSLGEALTGFAFGPDRACHGMLQCYDPGEINVAALIRAQKVFEDMGAEFNQEKYPELYTANLINLAALLIQLAPHTENLLYKAAVDMLSVVTELDMEQHPAQIKSRIYDLLGTAWYGYAGVEKNADHLSKAIAAFEKALEFTPQEEAPVWIAHKTNLGLSYVRQYEMTPKTGALQKARDAFTEADTACNPKQYPDHCFITATNVGDAFVLPGGSGDALKNISTAIAAYKKALEIPGLDTGTPRYKRVLGKLQSLRKAPVIQQQ